MFYFHRTKENKAVAKELKDNTTSLLQLNLSNNTSEILFLSYR